MNRLFYFFLLSICIFLFTGCGSFIRPVIFPEHSNSYDVTGEVVTIKMLTKSDVNADEDFKQSYKAVFNEDPLTDKSFTPITSKGNKVSTDNKSLLAPGAAAEVAAVVLPVILNFAVENINNELKKEASLHETQFTKTIVGDKFYAQVKNDHDNSYSLNYCGFEITRHTKQHPQNAPAFKLVFGIAPTADRTMFRIAPLSLEMRSSKAKVMAWKAWSFIPLFWWQLLFLNFDDEVNVKCDLAMNAIWVDKDGKMQKREHGAVNFNLPSYPLKETKSTNFERESVGWFPHIPKSIFPIEDPKPIEKTVAPGQVYWGNFELTITIKETDPSHAKEYLENAQKTIEKAKDDILEKLKKFKNLSKEKQQEILDQLKKAVDEKDVEKLWKIFEAI